ncbi:hypothetical protein CAPTEDRAFT_157997 [Capitella teleta]|uniref:DNA mismatch repair proteins mutS family domain-containing protein n=1 Tax=Capitella teleta TaxID=283909 RepID=R7VDN3_CAPTE|nr:hypothetical protein CAPTEDRAFT_157997 [Capitella teleta]|eukprot:ELU13785.1 hypothetical protein CAPTEDRAFT_157997 [Capitella teleta]
MTASIPTHRLFIHVQRLVAKGYKVGVVKQTETAALKAAGDNRSAPFTRELSALYTKSTLIGEDVDPESSGDASHSVNTFLMCIHETDAPNQKRRIAVVAVQPSTGDVVYDEFIDDSGRHQLDLRISHLRPVEILCCDQLSPQTECLLSGMAAVNLTEDDQMRIERMPVANFAASTSTAAITEFFKQNSEPEHVLKFVLAMPQSVLCCLQALIKYLRDFHLHSVLLNTSCFRHFSSDRQHMMLSASTLRNLEIFRNQTDGKEKGSLFWFLNQTQTRFGSRRLHEWLSKPLVQKGLINARLDAVGEIILDENPALRGLRSSLSRLPDLQRSLVTIQQKKCSTADFMSTCKALEQVKTVMENSKFQSDLLKNITERVPQLLSGVDKWTSNLSESAARVGDKTNLFIDLPEAVAQRQSEISAVLNDLEDHKRTLRQKLSNPRLEYSCVQGTEFLVEVKNSQLQMVPKDWTKINRHDISSLHVFLNTTKAVSRFHSPFIVASSRTLAQLREQLLVDAQDAWLQFLSLFDKCFIQYRTAVGLIADLDCLFSLAQVAQQHDFCRPQILEDCHQIAIQDGRHPVVDILLGENQQYVPNNTNLKGTGERCMIITGPNMGGKSSYIRQVAVIALLSHIGSFVPASSAEIGILDGIFTRMGAHDEMFAGRSTFMVELQETNDILQSATDRSLVILDELGRGTSTHDGQAIAHATLRHLVQEIGCLALFVTHYQSLSALELAFPSSVTNHHMSFLLDEGVLTFLYQCVRGAADRSYGLNVAKLADIPQSILSLASEKSKELEECTEHRVYLKRVLRLLWAEDQTEVQQGMAMLKQ